jgi:uncharacterized protein YjiS (DUF1127 family)
MISFLKRLSAAWMARRARRELDALSDHMLRDIGLRRNQIDALFR